jgi:beta-phosphoglucomutase-like phosphatase (HAD superfamily)
MPSKIKAICWDVDGTLVDTEQLYQETLQTVAAANGVAFPEGVSLDGIGARAAWKWFSENEGLMIPEEMWLEECSLYYNGHPEKILPRPGAKDAFDHFDSLGLPQCAVSSGTRAQVDGCLERSGVGERMLFSVAAENVRQTKPDPEAYLLARSALCHVHDWDATVSDNDCYLAIEDSVAGIFAAKRAGMVAIFWAKSPEETCAIADFTVHSKEELLDLCKKLTAPDAPEITAKPLPPPPPPKPRPPQ